MNAAAGAIALYADKARPRIQHQRVDLGALVVGGEASEAQRLIPRLLPVCAEAQGIAAQRAIDAALGIQETSALAQERDKNLLREQAQAAAWRILVDWPRALDQAPDLKSMKTFRSLEGPALGAALHTLLPTSLSSLVEATHEEVYQALTETTHTAAEPATLSEAMLRQTLACATKHAHFRFEALRGAAVWERARTYLGSPLTALGALAQGGMIDAPCLGPLALARHPLGEALRQNDNLNPVTRLILGALLDSQYLASALEQESSQSRTDEPQRQLGPGVGVGHAMTARGPLYHLVALDDDQRVRHWRYLAPTDWHFAPGGLAERLVEKCPRSDALGLCVTAADPCAPWSVHSLTQKDSEAA